MILTSIHEIWEILEKIIIIFKLFCLKFNRGPAHAEAIIKNVINIMFGFKKIRKSMGNIFCIVNRSHRLHVEDEKHTIGNQVWKGALAILNNRDIKINIFSVELFAVWVSFSTSAKRRSRDDVDWRIKYKMEASRFIIFFFLKKNGQEYNGVKFQPHS